jgi:hypothetical protein
LKRWLVRNVGYLGGVAWRLVQSAQLLGSSGALQLHGDIRPLVNAPLLFTSSALVPAKQMPEWLAAI